MKSYSVGGKVTVKKLEKTVIFLLLPGGNGFFLFFPNGQVFKLLYETWLFYGIYY